MLLFILLLSGCKDSSEEIQQSHIQFALDGESEHWEIESYELLYDGKRYEAGNGKITMKNTDEYVSDFFSISIQVVIDGESEKIQSQSVSGGDMDIGEHQIGTINGNRTDSNEAIHKEDIDQIYATVIWRDNEEKKDVKETIILYKSST
ncbi:hypothetical protein [Thalassobacillus devorans]|uniref:hypothetical protein n=1 Tax=Thalassobacillus devorans TaxID=279813 RepID=UPI001378E4A1|nr:hypothetical protein [Thalassobacillus devorans]